MKVLVVGATGGCGRAVVAELLGRGHTVTAFSRHASALRNSPESKGDLHTIDGDATDARAVDAAVAGHDAVVITLGISENPVRVRLRGPAHTALDVRSRGTRNVIAAMNRAGTRRLVVQSTYGVGATTGRLGLVNRLFFFLLIKPQAADHAEQERAVRASGLDWVIVQPVHLSGKEDTDVLVSPAGEIARQHVARTTVARLLADAAEKPDHVGESLAVSGAK